MCDGGGVVCYALGVVVMMGVLCNWERSSGVVGCRTLLLYFEL